MHDHLLLDIGVAVLAATALGLAAHWLRQPILLGYLLAGALVGPKLGFGLIQGDDSIEIISEIGLALLLFIIGLELDIKQVLLSGRQLLIAGFGQFLVCLAMGLGLFWMLGYGLGGGHGDGLYFALVCGLSSTAIVIKLLYDKGEFDTLPGRLTIGILIIQDIYAIFVLAFQPNFANPSVWPIARAVLGTAGLLAAGFLVSRYVLKHVFSSVARNPELVLAVSLGWCVLVAGLAMWLGLSKEMGALVAGLSIAAFPYSIHVTAKTLPLRDFFLTLFFVSLGMKLTAPTWGMAGPLALIVLFTIASRFLSVYPLIVLTGGGRRAGFVASLNLAQISEFSLVIASLGVAYGHIGESTVATVIYAMAITAVLSSYAIRYSHPLFLLFERLITRRRPAEHAVSAEESADGHHPEIVLLGYHRGARALADAVAKEHPQWLAKLLVIDFNPVSLEELKDRGIRGIFGDISSFDTLKHAHIAQAKVVCSTIPDMMLKGVDNASLVRMCRMLAPHAWVVVTADDAEHEQRLRAEGADLALRPFDLAGGRLCSLLADLLVRSGEPSLPAETVAAAPAPVADIAGTGEK
jgi:Kef-type K+ transport system membrane component KefB